MQEFLATLLAFPTIVFSAVLVAMVLLYWTVIIFGALDLDFLDSALGLDAAEGAFDGAVESLEGAAEGALEGGAEAFEGAAEGALDGQCAECIRRRGRGCSHGIRRRGDVLLRRPPRGPPHRDGGPRRADHHRGYLRGLLGLDPQLSAFQERGDHWPLPARLELARSRAYIAVSGGVFFAIADDTADETAVRNASGPAARDPRREDVHGALRHRR